MKKFVSLLLAGIMTFSVSSWVFADDLVSNSVTGAGSAAVGQVAGQSASDNDYKIVINGQSAAYSRDTVKFRDGTPLFTAEDLAKEFPSLGVDASKIAATAKPLKYGEVNYYAVQDVAEANGFKFFFDKDSDTALIIENQKYSDIKKYLTGLQKTSDLKTIDFDMNSKIDATIKISGLDQNGSDSKDIDQKVDVALDGKMQMDLEKNVVAMDMNVDALGQKTKLKSYENGEFTYTYDPVHNVWLRSASAMGSTDFSSMMQSLQSVAPSSDDLANGLTYAGLSFDNKDGIVTIEGNMYVGNIFDQFKTEDFVKRAMDSAKTSGVEVSDIKFNFPDTMYVKYVFGKDGKIQAAAFKADFDLSASFNGAKMDFNVNIDADIPRYTLNGNVDVSIPEEATKNAISMDEYSKRYGGAMTSQSSAESSQAKPAESVNKGSIYEKGAR